MMETFPSSAPGSGDHTSQVKLNYPASKFWLIFWFVVFFPIGLVLFATAAEFQLNGKNYYIRYNGSRFWLCVWTLAFFPVAVALLLLNGVSLTAGRPV